MLTRLGYKLFYKLFFISNCLFSDGGKIWANSLGFFISKLCTDTSILTRFRSHLRKSGATISLLSWDSYQFRYLFHSQDRSRQFPVVPLDSMVGNKTGIQHLHNTSWLIDITFPNCGQLLRKKNIRISFIGGRLTNRNHGYMIKWESNNVTKELCQRVWATSIELL